LRATKSWFIVRTSFQQPLETSLNAHSVAIAKLLPCLRMDGWRAFGKEDQLTTA
jgi:hypothetical protein